MTILIAEIGGNHLGDIAKCEELAVSAWIAGADIVKFQALGEGSLVSEKYDKERFDHFKKFEFSLKDWICLSKKLKEKYDMNISFSVWDAEWVDQLNQFVDIWKVGSGDITHRELIKKLFSTNKDIIYSTAMTSESEVDELIEFNYKNGYKNKISILQCQANYNNPEIETVNLAYTERLKEKYSLKVGYSHHALNADLLKVAIARQFDYIEFHYTNERRGDFRDLKLSITKKELAELINFRALVKKSEGNGTKSVNSNEFNERDKFRRSCYASRSIRKGDKITSDLIIYRRPLIGIPSEFSDNIIGKTAKCDIEAHSPIEYSSLR